MKTEFSDRISSVARRMRARFDPPRILANGPEASPPPDVLAELIDCLYAPLASLLVAAACGVFVGAIVSFRTRNDALLVCTLAMAAAAAGRVALALDYRAWDRKGLDDRDVLRRWERSYAIWAIVHASCFGALCFITVLWTEDVVSHLLVGATTIGYTAGVMARNSMRVRIALAQLTLSLAPLAVASVARGGFEYYALALLTLLYLVAAVEISLCLSRRNLRLLLLNRENRTLAADLAEQRRRLDLAIGNMSHGLCMFDAKARLVLSNERMCELYNLPAGAFTPGMSIRDMVARSVLAGNHAGREVDDVLGDCEKHLTQATSAHSRMRLSCGRTISWSRRALSEGGWVVIFEDVSERERAEAQARYLSTHDGLTDLPNRCLFDRRLEDAVKFSRRYGKRFCLMIIDLDRFKFINDTLGHGAGDLLLRETARRLTGCLRDSDVVGRLGGDEFVMILHDVASPRQAEAAARKIVETIGAPLTILDQECATSASIGIAMFPTDASDAPALLKSADAAMHLAKQEGKNNFRFFSSGMKMQSLERLKLESDLRHALARDEFVLYYQAVRNIATGAIAGVEALLRWRHPERGVLAPDRFIHIAEDTGLIVPIGKWVLETACAQNVAWMRQGLTGLRMAINLSPRQLSHAHLLDDIEAALDRSGMPMRLLELEITESMLMQDLKRSERLIRNIRERGGHIAIDDFGSGYSSMSRLRRLPIDTIKIDRSFVRGILAGEKDQAIAEAIIALGRALNLNIVAEGVETPEQEAFLCAHGCEHMQGFLFARPMPSAEFSGFASEHQRARSHSVEASRRPVPGIVPLAAGDR